MTNHSNDIFEKSEHPTSSGRQLEDSSPDVPTELNSFAVNNKIGKSSNHTSLPKIAASKHESGAKTY